MPANLLIGLSSWFPSSKLSLSPSPPSQMAWWGCRTIKSIYRSSNRFPSLVLLVSSNVSFKFEYSPLPCSISGLYSLPHLFYLKYEEREGVENRGVPWQVFDRIDWRELRTCAGQSTGSESRLFFPLSPPRRSKLAASRWLLMRGGHKAFIPTFLCVRGRDSFRIYRRRR